MSTFESQRGFYVFKLRAQSEVYPQLFVERDLTVNIEECIVTSFFVVEEFLDIEYEVNDAAIRSTIAPF